jgi:hypothetical protein
MGKFEQQVRDLVSSLQSLWRRHARGGAAGPPDPGGQPRRNPGDLRRTEAARKAEGAGRRAKEAVRDFRDSATARKAHEAVRDLRDSDTARKAQEAVRDLRNTEAAQKAQATMREFRESETGRKAESTIQEAEAAARAAYLRLRRSMGDR